MFITKRPMNCVSRNIERRIIVTEDLCFICHLFVLGLRGI